MFITIYILLELRMALGRCVVCGSFVFGVGELCKTHKRKSAGIRYQDKFQSNLRKNPQDLEKYNNRKLECERLRNGTDPANYRKRIPVAAGLRVEENMEAKPRDQKV